MSMRERERRAAETGGHIPRIAPEDVYDCDTWRERIAHSWRVIDGDGEAPTQPELPLRFPVIDGGDAA